MENLESTILTEQIDLQLLKATLRSERLRNAMAAIEKLCEAFEISLKSKQ